MPDWENHPTGNHCKYAAYKLTSTEHAHASPEHGHVRHLHSLLGSLCKCGALSELLYQVGADLQRNFKASLYKPVSFYNPVHSCVLKETSSHFELVNTEDRTMAETQTVSFMWKFWAVLYRTCRCAFLCRLRKATHGCFFFFFFF